MTFNARFSRNNDSRDIRTLDYIDVTTLDYIDVTTLDADRLMSLALCYWNFNSGYRHFNYYSLTKLAISGGYRLCCT